MNRFTQQVSGMDFSVYPHTLIAYGNLAPRDPQNRYDCITASCTPGTEKEKADTAPDTFISPGQYASTACRLYKSKTIRFFMNEVNGD